MQVKLQPDRTGISSSLVQPSIDYFGSLLGLTCADWVPTPPAITCLLGHYGNLYRLFLQRAKLTWTRVWRTLPLISLSCPLSNGLRDPSCLFSPLSKGVKASPPGTNLRLAP